MKIVNKLEAWKPSKSDATKRVLYVNMFLLKETEAGHLIKVLVTILASNISPS